MGMGKNNQHLLYKVLNYEIICYHFLGLKDMLMGTDPLRNSEEIWDELYTRTAMNGRRGMVIHAMGK